jgi:hypothetical protein
MIDKIGNPFQLLSLRVVDMWSFSRLEMQQEAMTAWVSLLLVLYHCTVSMYRFICDALSSSVVKKMICGKEKSTAYSLKDVSN